MGLFSSGTGKRSRRYAVQMMANNQLGYNRSRGELRRGASEARDFVTDARDVSRDYLSSAYTTSRDVLGGARNRADALLSSGMRSALARSDRGFNTARQDLITGRNAAVGQMGQAIDASGQGYADALAALQARYGQSADQLQGAVETWDPLLQQAMSGYGMYQNALGLNGAEGTGAAQDAFQEGPGYQWQVDQATSAAQRAANRTGSASGGGALDAVTRLSSNLANQEYGNWLDRLSGFQGAAETAASGRAGALTNLGQLYATQGGQEAELHTGRGAAEAALRGKSADIYNTAGQSLAANSQAQGTQAAGIHTDASKTRATNATNFAQLLAGLRTQYGQNQTNLATSYGGTMAGLSTGLAGALSSLHQNVSNANNQALGVALQGSNQQGAENASWGKALLDVGTSVLGMGVSGGGTLGGNFLSSLFK